MALTRKALQGWALALWLLPFTALPVFAASPFVPLDHPAYEAVESWSARGVIPTQPTGIRPITWQRLARLLSSATTQNPQDQSRLTALQREAKQHTHPTQGRWLAFGVETMASSGDAVTFPTVPAVANGPLINPTGGRRFSEPLGADIRLRIEQQLGSQTAMVFIPRLDLARAGGGNPAWQQGYVITDWGPTHLVIGRQPIVWGPGRSGGFVMSDNAPPLPALRLGSTRALQLPGFLRSLGAIEFDLFASRLEKDRVVPHPILSGLRLTWQPTGWITWGLSRTTMLGGEGRPTLHGGDLFTILTGRNLIGADDTSNSIAGIDLSVRVPNPFSDGRMTLYGEYAGEDEAGFLPTKPALRGGMLVPGLGRLRNHTVRLSFAATDVVYDHQKWGHSVWYAHGIYRSGYTFRGRIMGDAMGPDAREASLRVTRQQVAADHSLALTWRAFRFSAPEREVYWQTEYRRSLRLSDRWRLKLATALARVVTRNPSRQNWEGAVSLMLSATLPTAVAPD